MDRRARLVLLTIDWVPEQNQEARKDEARRNEGEKKAQPELDVIVLLRVARGGLRDRQMDDRSWPRKGPKSSSVLKKQNKRGSKQRVPASVIGLRARLASGTKNKKEGVIGVQCQARLGYEICRGEDHERHGP